MAQTLGGAAELRRKLLWLVVFRTIATTLLLAVIAVRLVSRPASEVIPWEDSMSLGVIGLVYVLTIVYGLLLKHGRAGIWVAYAQVMGDVVVASGLVYLTGGLESPFTFAYSLAVVGASILLHQSGALVTAGASSVAFGALALLIRAGVLRRPWDAHGMEGSLAAFVFVSNVLAQFLIAILASYVARQLAMTGVRLSASEADLKKLASLQRQILTCMPSGLMTCGSDGAVTFINPAASGILGLDHDPASNFQLERLLPGISKLLPSTRRGELTVQTTGGARVLGLSITPLEAGDGSLLVVFQDLTELRKMEGEIKRVDRLAALGTLSAQLAHEIRNPLAAMRGSAQLLSTENASGATARLSGILLRESDRLSKLVDEFLQFARPPPPELSQTPLKELVNETVEMARLDPIANGVQIEVECSEVAARADASQLRQVLLNLLRNALQAVRPAGQVKVRVAEEDGAPRIEVWDSAGSIPAGDLDRVFEPFFTTRPGGTGLGLSMAHSIVRANGGTIQVRSSPERGTAFIIGLLSGSEA